MAGKIRPTIKSNRIWISWARGIAKIAGKYRSCLVFRNAVIHQNATTMFANDDLLGLLDLALALRGYFSVTSATAFLSTVTTVSPFL